MTVSVLWPSFSLSKFDDLMKKMHSVSCCLPSILILGNPALSGWLHQQCCSSRFELMRLLSVSQKLFPVLFFCRCQRYREDPRSQRCGEIDAVFERVIAVGGGRRGEDCLGKVPHGDQRLGESWPVLASGPCRHLPAAGSLPSERSSGLTALGQPEGHAGGSIPAAAHLHDACWGSVNSYGFAQGWASRLTFVFTGWPYRCRSPLHLRQRFLLLGPASGHELRTLCGLGVQSLSRLHVGLLVLQPLASQEPSPGSPGR